MISINKRGEKFTMKQTIKKIVSLLVILCLSMSMLMLVACNQKPEGDDDGGDSSPSVQVTVDDIKFENRANYNAENIETAYMENSLYDVMYTPDTASKNMKGYLLGDVYNIVIEQAKMLIAQDPSLAQVKLDIFTFTRDTQGNWRNYNKAEVHPIMNKLLNYKVDSNEDFALTEAELKTYGNVKLFTLLRESVANTKIVYNNTTVSEGNAELTATLNKTLDSLFEALSVPMVKQTLEATVADFTKLVAGTATEQGEMFNKLYGSIKVGELAGMFTDVTTLPVEVTEMPLSNVKAWLDEVNEAGGFGVYFGNIISQFVMPMTMGDIMTGFGVKLPDNLAAYTVAEVVAELQAMVAPAQPAPTPAPTAEGEGTTDNTTETEEPQKSFLADLRAYLCGLTIPVSQDVTLQGEELVNFVEQLVGILTTKYEGATTLEQFDGMVKALNAFVTTNDTRMTQVVTALDASGMTISFDGVTMLKPSEAFTVVKDFLSQGETYQTYMNMLANTTVEQYLTANNVAVSVTGVKKVDDFVNKYKAMTLADFINNMSTFQAELTTLENSLTLNDQMILSGYGYLAENKAVKTFMATYGDMTQAEINAKMTTEQGFAEAYTEAMMTLYKNLKVKDLVPQAPVA